MVCCVSLDYATPLPTGRGGDGLTLSSQNSLTVVIPHPLAAQSTEARCEWLGFPCSLHPTVPFPHELPLLGRLSKPLLIEHTVILLFALLERDI